MRIDIVSCVPDLLAGAFEESIMKRARDKGYLDLHIHNLHDYAYDRYRRTDDYPFGGGAGMVMMAEPLAQTVDFIRASGNRGRVVSFAPNGTRLTDERVRRFVAEGEDVVLICGRYEGIDERFLSTYVDEVVSLGDFVLSGGELPACALIDAVVRQLPGAIKDLSASDESFATGLLDAPHYTRPEVWRGMPVPPVLLSGHHANILDWTRKESLALTLRTRPDLIKIANSSGLPDRADKKYLRSLGWQEE